MLIPEERQKETMYRITKCCGNCSNFSYYGGNQRRGVCLFNLTRPTNFHNKNMYDKYPRTHIMALCDEHIFRSKKGFKKVYAWCQAEILEDYEY